MLISKKKERRREEKEERGTERRKAKQNVTRARIGTFLSSHHCAYAVRLCCHCRFSDALSIFHGKLKAETKIKLAFNWKTLASHGGGNNIATY